VAAVVLAIALVAVVIGATTVAGLGSTTMTTEAFPAATAIRMDLDHADIDLVAGGDEVVVESRVRSGPFDPDATAEVDDDTLELTLNCIADWLWLAPDCSGEYLVQVPAGTTVTGSTGNGDVRIEGLVEAVGVSASNGTIDLVGTTGPVDVHTSNGAIAGFDLGSATVVASTSNGEVSLDFGPAPTDVTVRTVNGSIEVGLPQDGRGWDLDMETTNGSTTTVVAGGRAAIRTALG